MICRKGWWNMANRLKMTCFKRTVTAEAGGPAHSEHVLSDNENLLNLSGFNDLAFEPGKEYYVDFCKVIGPRKTTDELVKNFL